jgi:hypothetical protein
VKSQTGKVKLKMNNKGFFKKTGLIYWVESFTQWQKNNKRKRLAQYLKSRTKIFCIGRNKTGTTSLKKAFEDLGFVVGNQRKAELLSAQYWQKDFDAIVDYCTTAEVFQDFPFSYPETYKQLDKAFPGSKFILTVRDNPEQWYNSVTKFHAKLFGNGKIPTVQQLQNAPYVHKGWMWENLSRLYGVSSKENPYDKEKLVKHYEKHNADVIEYFKSRNNDLLVINLSDPDAYTKFCEFIGVKSDKNNFPWENKTSVIPIK